MGTVREDYSDSGDAWNYFTHDQSRSRAYRWGEDGLAGFSDDKQRLCFALALWNGRDAILKERPEEFQTDPHWRDLISFHEYFHGDNGAGIGASHQTGWTGVIAALIQLFGRVDARTFLEGVEGKYKPTLAETAA